MGCDDCAGVELCPPDAWRVVCDDGAQILGVQTVTSGKTRFFRTFWVRYLASCG